MTSLREKADAQSGLPAALFPALVLVVTALPFVPALSYGFVYDDDAAIVHNGAIRTWQAVSVYLLPSALQKNTAAMGMNAYNVFRPLFYAWLHVNYALFGLNPIGWHLASLCVHLCATLAVFYLLTRHFRDPWIATAGAVVFGVHPVHIESVVWVSSATDSLATVGIVASLLLWMRNTESPRAGLRAASLACYGAALLFKETAIVLPAIVFVYGWFAIGLTLDHTSDQKDNTALKLRGAFCGALPSAVLSVIYLIARAIALHGSASRTMWISAREVLTTQPWPLLFYLRHLVWPAGLSVFYDLVPVSNLRDPRFWYPLLILAFLAGGALLWWRSKQERNVPAAAAWLLIPLAPVLNIAFFQKEDFAHDRYLYLPCLGLAVLVCLLLDFLVHAAGGIGRSVAFVGATTLIVALAFSTVAQAQPWHDDLTLYSFALQRSRNTGLRNNLASEYATRGRYEEANALLEPLVKEVPDSWLINYNYGYVSYRLKRLDIAEQYLGKAISIDGRDGDEFAYLGLTYYREGRLSDAAADLRQAITRSPGAEGYHLALGMVLAQEHDVSAARAEFVAELEQHPEEGAALQQLAALDSANSSMSPEPAAQRAIQ